MERDQLRVKIEALEKIIGDIKQELGLRDQQNDILTEEMHLLEGHLKVLETQNQHIEQEIRSILDSDETVRN
jgi:hypothetical protein